MNKELTPLKAYEELKCQCCYNLERNEYLFRIIETALKDYEKKNRALLKLQSFIERFGKLGIIKGDYYLTVDGTMEIEEKDYESLNEVLL